MESFQILDFEALRSPEGTLLSLFRRGITHMGRKSGFNRGCKHSQTGKVHGWKLDVIFLFIMAYALLTTSQVSHPLELGSLFWVSKMPFGGCWRIVTLVTLFVAKVLYSFHHLLSHSHSSDAAFCTYAVMLYYIKLLWQNGLVALKSQRLGFLVSSSLESCALRIFFDMGWTLFVIGCSLAHASSVANGQRHSHHFLLLLNPYSVSSKGFLWMQFSYSDVQHIAKLMVVWENYSICITLYIDSFCRNGLDTVDLLEVIYLLSEGLHMPQGQNM